jgi:hypothetical protein
MSQVREERCRLAVSLALAYKDFEVYQNARVGDEIIDIKAEKFINGVYDRFYVIVKVVKGSPKIHSGFMDQAESMSDKLKLPVYLAILKDDATEMMLDARLRKRMLVPVGTRIVNLPSPTPGYDM